MITEKSDKIYLWLLALLFILCSGYILSKARAADLGPLNIIDIQWDYVQKNDHYLYIPWSNDYRSDEWQDWRGNIGYTIIHRIWNPIVLKSATSTIETGFYSYENY